MFVLLLYRFLHGGNPSPGSYLQDGHLAFQLRQHFVQTNAVEDGGRKEAAIENDSIELIMLNSSVYTPYHGSNVLLLQDSRKSSGTEVLSTLSASRLEIRWKRKLH
jgi:hypothetical protein